MLLVFDLMLRRVGDFLVLVECRNVGEDVVGSVLIVVGVEDVEDVVTGVEGRLLGMLSPSLT